ncbi:hypothetical protein DY000_02025604 [Brassica cretica]|uniref:Uncharacterized protein n=1 Tax=Brassica cretica TaxID=69181 RepID=A0ABQ7EC65_BRACR|nr:hypothetical protein DY000_02025604 [Brassica cretica]
MVAMKIMLILVLTLDKDEAKEETDDLTNQHCICHQKIIQVLAERELKIQGDVKEIRKVFYCELCS